MEELIFGRVIPAMVTPFKEDGSLDLDRAAELADRLISKGVDALVVCATTGESPTTTRSERIELFSAVIPAVGGRVPVIAYTSDNCTADSIDLTQRVDKLGCDGFLFVVPYYNKPPQEGLYQHFSAVAHCTDKPALLYNIPGRSAINMTAETTLRLARDVDNIIGIKEASGNLEQIETICRQAPEGFYVYSGDDDMTLSIMEVGGVGVVSTTANVAPELMHDMVYAQAEGDVDRAHEVYDRLSPLMKELFTTTNPILVKKALELQGFPCGGLRLPLIDANEEQTASLKQVMGTVGVL